MSLLNIAAIVEGDGEVGAVPVLLRRHAELLGLGGRVKIHPIRQPASRLLRPGELERVVELAARKVGVTGGILVLIDCEDQCPARLGPELLGRIRRARDDLPVSMVLAHREFEAWFVGSAESIAGRRDLPPDLRSHPAPESVRGCKEWLSQQMPRGRSYDAFRDQPALAAVFDMDRAKQACPSFDKCHREMIALREKVDRRVAMDPV
jgi:hypothetical protein